MSADPAPPPARPRPSGLPPVPSQSTPVIERIPEVRRRVVSTATPSQPQHVALQEEDIPQDVLVVVSKLKAYIRARSGMNTSATVNEPLSELIRGLCDEAIQRAAADERKTVMGRDFSSGD